MKPLIVLFTLLLSACLCLLRTPLLVAAPVAANTPTPTPAEEPANAVMTTTVPLTDATAAPTLADLQVQITALQAQVADLAAAHDAEHTADLNQVTTAVYLLDNAGLHDLDDRLNEQQVIEPGDAGQVARVSRLLASVAWPAPLATTIVTLTRALTDLSTALANDDLAAAAPLATQVHEVQHDFSQAVAAWAAAAAPPAHGAGQAFRVTSAVYLLDSAGLHALDVQLNEQKTIQPGDSGRVARLVGLLNTVDWPAPLATSAITLTTVLTDLATALANNDLATAAPLAAQAHAVQHDFSHAAEHWLAAVTGHADATTPHAEEEQDDGHHDEGDETPGDGDHQENAGG